MKILVADDSQILRAAVSKLLAAEGYEVVEAADGVEAATRIFEQRPALILLDLSMPGLNGYVVCRLVKEDPVLAATPVLILTGRDSVEDRYWAERSGADGYVTKDSLGQGLVGVINSALASRALMELSRQDTDDPPALGETDVMTRVCEMLDRKLFEATVVGELSALAADASRLDDVLASVFEHMTKIVAFDVAALALADDRSIYAYAHEQVADNDATEVADFAMRQLASVLGTDTLAASELMWFGRPGDGRGVVPSGWGSWYAAGLRAHGTVVGLLVLVARGKGAFPSSVARTLRTIEPPIATVVSAAQEFTAALAREVETSFGALYGR
ncbi:MAG: PleD family two-component system response regulator [Acidimicrobiia bacterium]